MIWEEYKCDGREEKRNAEQSTYRVKTPVITLCKQEFDEASWKCLVEKIYTDKCHDDVTAIAVSMDGYAFER